MIEQNLPNGNIKDGSSGNLDPNAASVKFGGPDNAAYGGLPQSDDPKVLNLVGEVKTDDKIRYMLQGKLVGIWESNKSFRESNGIDTMFTNALNMFDKKYTPEEESKIKQRGFPPVFFPLATHKVHTANAWIDEFFTNGETLFNVKPTPMPELQDDVTARTFRAAMNDIAQIIRQTGKIPDAQMVATYAANRRQIVEQEVDEDALIRAHKVEKVLHDDLIQGGWAKAIHDVICYMCLYGTAGMRSPVIKKVNDISWKDGKITRTERVTREFEAVSPFDIFPSAGMTDSQRGDLCIRLHYYPSDLAKMRGNAMWIDDAIDKALESYSRSGLRLEVSSDSRRETLTDQRPSIDSNDQIEGFEYFGDISGDMLHEIGLTSVKRDGKKMEIKNSSCEFYHVNAIVMGTEVVYCNVLMDDEDRNFDIVKFYDTPGKFFGEGPLQLIESCQKICNAAGRSLVTNMGWSSMPQCMGDLSQIDPRDDLKMFPGKFWAYRRQAMGQQSGDPIKFFNIESNVEQFLRIFEFFMRLADEVTGIPAYANGTDATTGAARTATGLNMLMGQANRGIKYTVGNLDNLCNKSINRLHKWHLMYNKDDSIKGDVYIQVTGLKYFTTKTARANDLLELISRITQDPRMMQLQSLDKLAKMMREIAISFDLDPDALAPAMDELRRMQMQQQQAQSQQAQQAQAAMDQQQANELEQINAETQAKAEAQTAGQRPTTETGRPTVPTAEDTGGVV